MQLYCSVLPCCNVVPGPPPVGSTILPLVTGGNTHGPINNIYDMTFVDLVDRVAKIMQKTDRNQHISRVTLTSNSERVP